MKRQIFQSITAISAASMLLAPLLGLPFLAMMLILSVIVGIVYWASTLNKFDHAIICSLLFPFIMKLYDADPNGVGGGVDDKAKETALLGKIAEKMEKQLENRATKEELTQMRTDIMKTFEGMPLDALRSMLDDKTGVMAMITNQGLEITKLQNAAKVGGDQKDLSVRAQVEAWQKDNAVNIAKIKDGEMAPLKPLNIRSVASPMTVATVNATSSNYIGRTESEGGVNMPLRYPLGFWDFLTKGRTSAETYTWVNMVNEQGTAAFIAPGQLKPGVSFELAAEKSNAKKIAASAKAAMELLQDIDGMVSFIEDEVKYKVFEKMNSTLISSTGSSTVPTGVRQLSTTYTTTGIATTSPNIADAIRAIIAQLRSGKLTGEITVFVNSIDAANMEMQKDSTGGYTIPPFMTADGNRVAGAKIIEDPNIPVGFVQAGFFRFYKILIYQDFSISWGWENDDFTRNLMTVIGEMRIHQFFNSQFTGAFVYDEFVRIIPLITKQ